MLRKIISLIFINTCSAMGYSLIAPLYFIEAEKRLIGKDICGLVIGFFALANFITTPFVPRLINGIGRRNIFYLSCILEALSTLSYGILYYIQDYHKFIIFSLIIRFFHGFGASLSATLGLGIALGPMCASIFYYLGGYTLPFYFCGIMIITNLPLIYNLELIHSDEIHSPSFLDTFFDFTTIPTIMAIIFDIFTKTFFYPTLSSHLINKFGISIEMSSSFFVIHIISYSVVLAYINKITTRFGLKFTICIGLFLNSIASLMISPIEIFPQSYYIVIIGLFILGIPGALISVPGICDLIEIIQNKHPNFDGQTTNDMASAIYNLGVNLGEAMGPSFGGYITKEYNFGLSCICTSSINLVLGISFIWYNMETIKSDLFEYEEVQDNVHLIPSDQNQYIRFRKLSHESDIIGIISRCYSRSRIYSYDFKHYHKLN